MTTVKFLEAFQGYLRYCFIKGCNAGAIKTARFADHFRGVHGAQLVVAKNISKFIVVFQYDLDAKEGDVRVPCVFQIEGLHFAFTALFHKNEYKFWVYYLEGRHENQIRKFTAELLFNCRKTDALVGKVYPMSYSIRRILDIWKDPKVGITISRDELMQEFLGQKEMGMQTPILYINVELHLLDLSLLPVITEYPGHEYGESAEMKTTDVEKATDIEENSWTKDLASVEYDESDEDGSWTFDPPKPLRSEKKLPPIRRLFKKYLDLSTMEGGTGTKQKEEESEQSSSLNVPEKIDDKKQDASETTETDEAMVDNGNTVGSSDASVVKSNDNSFVPPSSSATFASRLNKDLRRMKIHCPNCSCIVMQQVFRASIVEEDQANGDIKVESQIIQQINDGDKEEVKTEEVVPKSMLPKTM